VIVILVVLLVVMSLIILVVSYCVQKWAKKEEKVQFANVSDDDPEDEQHYLPPSAVSLNPDRSMEESTDI